MAAGTEVILGLLIKEIGQPIAQKLWSVMSAEEKQKQLLRAIDLINQGSSAVEACSRSFGSLFGDMITDALKNEDLVFSSGLAGYITVQPKSDDTLARLKALRAEMGLNLDRLAKQSLDGQQVEVSQFKGFLSEWEERLHEMLEVTDSDEKALESVHTLLDGSHRNGWQVFQVLVRSGFGIAGSLLILQAVLLMTSAGMGVIAASTTWLFGLPIGQIIALAGTGAFMLVLSRIKFDDTRVLNTCVSTLERLLRRKIKAARRYNVNKTVAHGPKKNDEQTAAMN